MGLQIRLTNKIGKVDFVNHHHQYPVMIILQLNIVFNLNSQLQKW